MQYVAKIRIIFIILEYYNEKELFVDEIYTEIEYYTLKLYYSTDVDKSSGEVVRHRKIIVANVLYPII